LVLAYREGLTPSEADARTMLTMLLLNKFFDEETVDVQRTRLVAEILDSRRAELARVANADDLVVSDNLAALMASQLSQNPHLDPVLKDLFDADGAAINVCTGQPSSVVDVAHALAKGLDLAIEPEVVGKYRAGDIRHCFGDPTRAADLLGVRAEMEVGTGLGQLAEWLAGQEADDRVDEAMAELRRRGLER